MTGFFGGSYCNLFGMILPLTRSNAKTHDSGLIRSLCLWFLLLVLVLLAFPQYTLGLLSRVLVVDEPPLSADAIVILLGTGTADRVLRADELFKKNFAPRIVFASGYIDQKLLTNAPQGFTWPSLSSPYQTALQSLGVPKSAIVEIPARDAYDSAHELTDIAAYARKAGWRRVLLVSSAGHTRRVDLIWRRIGKDIEHITIAAQPVDLDHWWTDGRKVRSVGYELGALVKESWAQILRLVP
jgi:uncharacterized SAM-binding protein YcdF (DUF218 family)